MNHVQWDSEKNVSGNHGHFDEKKPIKFFLIPPKCKYES